MSNLENLTQKIIDDAKSSAEGIIKEAEKKKEGLVSSRLEEAERLAEEILERANNEAEAIRYGIVSNAKLKARDKKISAKRNTMERTFQLAKSSFTNMNEKDYLNFLKSNIGNLKLKGTENLIVSENMRDSVKNAGFALQISDTETVDSGFMIKDKNTILNYTFDSIVDYLRDELESSIVHSLFKE
ncbi:V-type ATP synthase subunit E [Paratissierella segnis]|jgi:V/A-type H+-transporting ATPase subunit E|uniref:V-ATPase subunit E n=1 Tax=Paratissierella segnis TaxID=2763679 RepID=A0A926III4_9FIRM|nr:V-type ATP synthase subunit E [Paratissierella segnis]MBC8586994.1 hypothetical protein [Paratissierella segnis]